MPTPCTENRVGKWRTKACSSQLIALGLHCWHTVPHITLSGFWLNWSLKHYNRVAFTEWDGATASLEGAWTREIPVQPCTPPPLVGHGPGTPPKRPLLHRKWQVHRISSGLWNPCHQLWASRHNGGGYLRLFPAQSSPSSPQDSEVAPFRAFYRSRSQILRTLRTCW